MSVAERLKRFLINRWVIAAGLVVVCGMIVVGVAFRRTVVYPPVRVVQTQPVFLLVHDRHSSLVIPAGGGRLIRYSYGDWQYYAEGITGALSATRAILWPTGSAFGRRETRGVATAEGVRAAVSVFIDEMHVIPVDGERVERLRARLDELHRTQSGPRLDNYDADMEFVPHPHAYSAFHNSNQVVGMWLEELGCRVSGHGLLSRWEVRR